MSFEAQLEAEPLRTNQQLLDFDIRSKDINWRDYVKPLKSRCPGVYLSRQFHLMGTYVETMLECKKELFIIHDMMNNYLEDRHYNSSRKFDDYRFYHWSSVDYFCYFSHHYISIPPCVWINAAHEHGVKVLGTFLTENRDGFDRLHELLESKEMIDNIVDSLVKLCNHYGFEGWLINIECNVHEPRLDNLSYFIDSLRTAIEDKVTNGVIFWYDSVINNGDVRYQNELNEKNAQFLKLSHGMLVNYNWNDKSLEDSGSFCKLENIADNKVFFGVDVFGRGQIAEFQSKYTLARIMQHKFSIGMFAIAWTYESLRHYGYDLKQPLGNDETNETFLLRNEKFWWLLWEHLATHPYHELPFYSHFCLGSGKRFYEYGKPKLLEETKIESNDSFFNLSCQSLQPSIPLYEHVTRYYQDAYNGGSCLCIKNANNTFRIFTGEFTINNYGIVFAYAYKLKECDGTFDCVLRLGLNDNTKNVYLFLGDYDIDCIEKGRCYLSALKVDYYNLLIPPLLCPQIQIDSVSNNDNEWRVRYYIISVDSVIKIKDIGVLYNQKPEATDTAYLGAIYLNEFDVNLHQFPDNSNVIYLPIKENDLLIEI